ncbi:MAG: PilZ domain-containing protein, partial [Desulfuromonadales bacterium]|nr:PilZ domain-containing protein [Desulfuromonadales bacterium]
DSWGFILCRRDDLSALLLAEEGACRPMAGQQPIWLCRFGATGRDQILLPVALESLWQTVEQKFHHPPRKHLRMVAELKARIFLRGEWFETTLFSLSDMGARITTDREVVKQEDVSIEFSIDDDVLKYNAQIIFSVPKADSAQFQSGILFSGQNIQSRAELRSILIRRYLKAIRERMDRRAFQDGLAFLDLPPEVRRKLLQVD